MLSDVQSLCSPCSVALPGSWWCFLQQNHLSTSSQRVARAPLSSAAFHLCFEVVSLGALEALAAEAFTNKQANVLFCYLQAKKVKNPVFNTVSNEFER